jgi:hypothetical protein
VLGARSVAGRAVGAELAVGQLAVGQLAVIATTGIGLLVCRW